MTNDLTAQEAIDIWGPIQEQVKKEDAERGVFFKLADKRPIVKALVTKVYTLENYDKNGQDPAVDVDANGQKITVKAGTTVLKKKLAVVAPRVGDLLSIENIRKVNGRYWDLDVTLERDGKTVGSDSALGF